MQPDLKDKRRVCMERALELGAEARRCADAADWEGLRVVTRERDALLREFFASPQGLGEARWLREALERIVAGDAELLERLRARREEIAEKTREMRRMSAAARLYRICGGSELPDNVVPFAARRSNPAADRRY